MHKISHPQTDSQSQETRPNQNRQAAKRETPTYLAVVATVPGSAVALVDWGRLALLHRPLHFRQNLSVPRLCSQGLPAVEVVRHQHSRASGVAISWLAATAVLCRLVATLARHSGQADV